MYCPKDGTDLQYVETIKDVVTEHDLYWCPQCLCIWECITLKDNTIRLSEVPG